MKIKLLLAAATLLAATACNKTEPATTSAPAPAAPNVVAVSVGSSGFSPSDIKLAKGQSATLRFTRTTDETCAKKVVFPALHVEKDLPLNQAVDVSVPTDAPRELAFQCGMGMMKSRVVVE